VRRFCIKTQSNRLNAVHSRKCGAHAFGQPVPSTHPHLLSSGEVGADSICCRIISAFVSSHVFGVAVTRDTR
jgi:hypothetical protein